MNESKEIIDFYKECVQNGYRSFAEIGVWIGLSLRHLVIELKKTGEPFTVYAVDLWDELDGDTNGEGLQKNSFELFKKHMGEYLQDVIIIKKESNLSALDIEDQSLDIVFIDASHDYESVSKNISSWLPKIKINGYLSGHDYGEPCGVKQAVDEKFKIFETQGTIWKVQKTI